MKYKLLLNKTDENDQWTNCQSKIGIRPGLFIQTVTILEYFNMDLGQCGECWHASYSKYLELMLVKLGKTFKQQFANMIHMTVNVIQECHNI